MLMSTAEYANKLSKSSERVKSMQYFLDLLEANTQILDVYRVQLQSTAMK